MLKGRRKFSTRPSRPFGNDTRQRTSRDDRHRSARGFPHEWCERDPDQKSFGIEEAADCLTPGFFLVLYEYAMSSRFELRRGLLDIINVEFEPGVRDGNVAGPGSMTAPLAAVARARSFCAFQGFSIS